MQWHLTADLAQLKHSLDQLKALTPLPHGDIAATHLDITAALNARGKHNAALVHARAAASACAEGHCDTSDALTSIALTLYVTGQWREALQTAQVAQRTSVPEPGHTARRETLSQTCDLAAMAAAQGGGNAYKLAFLHLLQARAFCNAASVCVATTSHTLTTIHCQIFQVITVVCSNHQFSCLASAHQQM